ncbi:hypothetical protein Fmac_021240 [Flemingia macrophylla]|uniref:Bulb-type lectin domain-containing protein n=1 Tax=Flemingia macrophylla TaxID=520843 RepID=A0ABD1LWS4_9FABA
MSGTSTSLDTLTVDQSLHDEQTLVSEGGIIAVGFFSPGNSTRRYLGVWYTNISPITVVWVANRNKPLQNTKGVLKLNEKGTLELLNDRNITIWSSNISTKAVNNPVAHPLDSGNFVVRNAQKTKDGILWQSFDYPGDTLISDGGRATCECLRRYVPKLPDQWNEAVWFDGCVPRNKSNCKNSNTDGFLTYTHLKLPVTSSSWFNRTMNLDECRKSFLKNCSCAAYANLDIRDGGTGYLLWFNTLTDMRKFFEWGQALYIRVPASEIGTRRKLYGKCYKIRQRREDVDLPTFDLSVLATATENFATKNKLGEGGFGPVYKGKLTDGQELAVKRLSKKSGQGLEEFKNEVALIAKLQHRNLAWTLWTEDRVLELLDEVLGEQFMPSEVIRCIQVGLLCVQQRPEDRPDMSLVVLMLNGDKLLPKPKPLLSPRYISSVRRALHYLAFLAKHALCCQVSNPCPPVLVFLAVSFPLTLLPLVVVGIARCGGLRWMCYRFRRVPDVVLFGTRIVILSPIYVIRGAFDLKLFGPHHTRTTGVIRASRIPHSLL